MDSSLLVLYKTTGSISIAPFTNVIGAPVGIAIVNVSLSFLFSTRIMKKLLKITKNK